jgi:hypothetical protein
MNAKRTGLLRVLMPWLCAAVVACGSNGTEVTKVAPAAVRPPPTELAATLVAELPTVGLTPEETRTLPEDTATEPVTVIPATEEPSPTEDILADLAQELLVNYGGAGGGFCDEVPAGPLPAAEGEVWYSHSGWICLWGFPAGSAVSVQFYDPWGQFVAAREVTVDAEQEGVGVAEILLSFAGQPAGDWTVVANSSGMHLEVPFHVAEASVPVISIVPGGSDLFASVGPMDWVQIPYVPGEQVAIFGAGFPPGRSLPLGIYYGDMDGEAAHLVTSQEVQADEQGRFEVNQPVEALALLGEGLYYAIVPLDPSYQPRAFGYDPLGALGGFVVPSPGAHAGDVTLLLECGGGPLDDPSVQQAIVAAVNRLHLSDDFGGAPVTFLFSLGGTVIDVTEEPWDPNLARQLLAEAGYSEGANAELVYPLGDEELGSLAGSIGRNLANVGLSVSEVALPLSDIDAYIQGKLSSGESVFWLVRY